MDVFRFAVFLLALNIVKLTAAPASLEFFEAKIRPVLVAECYECHAGKKSRGGLRLDYREALLKGGDSGPALVPGDAARSLLIQTIRHERPDQEMPKDGAKLDGRIINDFVTWINKGAFDPRDAPPTTNAVAASWADTLALRRQWWSLQAVLKPTVPSPTNATWSEQPVDRFLLAQMEAHGLEPAAPADPRTFIRRLTFALTGLPPTSQEIEAFLHDCGDQEEGSMTRLPQPARARLVDRLLASPAFGERWARHWMDLMRYAETHGSESDPEIRSAWRYRDYLIRAFNADVPADQLIREHLAGDLLPASRVRWNKAEGLNESIIGVASLRLNEHGFQPIDTLDEQTRVIENQIDVIGKAFQGLTIACARCHDHKFDAVSQRDYYALYGVLASTRPAQVAVDAPEVLNRHRAELASLKARIKSGLADAWRQAVPDLVAQLQRGSGVETQRAVLQKRMRKLEGEIASLEAVARAKILAGGSVSALTESSVSNPRTPRVALVPPIARWSFNQDARDQTGSWHGELVGGARIRDGRLTTDGGEAHLRTAPLGRELREKTLEAWVALPTLDQGGGGVLTVESANGAIFDSIVFAEKEPGKWVNGSDNFRRSRNLGGAAETASPGELVHVAITYSAAGEITFFRNGNRYASPFTPDSPLVTFGADARVLLGRRHTGGGQAFLTSEIDEARVYDRALTPEEIAASFHAGLIVISPEELAAAMTPDQKAEYAARGAELSQVRRELEAQVATLNADRLGAALNEAKTNAASPLHAWTELSGRNGAVLASGWAEISNRWHEQLQAAGEHNARFQTQWNLADGGHAEWFRHGTGLSLPPARLGEFSIEAEGDRVVHGLLPAGVFSHLLSQMHGGLFTSPRFKIETDWISVRVAGGKGAMVRLIVDNYPLGVNPVFPKAELERDETGWVRLDTAYRKGSRAYLEVATSDLLTRRGKGAESQPRSWFGIERVVSHDAKEAPREEPVAGDILFHGQAPKSSGELAARYAEKLDQAIIAWRENRLSEPQRAFLDFFVRRELLPVKLKTLTRLEPLVVEFRRLESEIPPARHAPGVLDGTPYDAPLMERGNHLKPTAPVPRGYVEVLGQSAFFGRGEPRPASGRLELANVIASPGNPLTARVMVNRVWQHLFGRGLVPTVDNFGRLGEQPTHPELLDYLATRFVEDAWSFKRLMREIVFLRAYQMSGEPSEVARATDSANQWLSHFPTHRLEAEAVRDAILAVSGRLDATPFGPPPGGSNPPRRSVYLAVQRTSLNPFLESFDAPKPFTTLGKRDVTNVPAQSLALLNDPFVIEAARHWAASVIRQMPEAPTEARIRTMFVAAFARPPSPPELETARAYIGDLAGAAGVPAEGRRSNERVWQDFAHALFNLKEFIYVR